MMSALHGGNARQRLSAALPAIAIFAVALTLSADGPQRSRPTAARRPQAPKATDETWQVMYVGKSRIGYSRTLSRLLKVDGRMLRKTESEMRIVLKRFGQTVNLETRQEFEESLEGELQSFVFEVKNPPANPVRTVGRVRDDRLVGQTTVAGSPREFSLPWEAGTRSPVFIDRLPQERPFNRGDVVSYKVFQPEQMQASDVRLSAGRRESVTLLDGRRHPLLKLTTMSSLLPQSPLVSYVDERGQTRMSSTDLLGQELVTYTVDAAEALKEVAGGELDVAVNTLVRSTVIPHAHQTRRAVYRIQMRGEDPTPFFPNDAGQKVIRKGPTECEIVVKPLRAEPTNRSVRVDRQYLSASHYLQTTDPDVLMHVERAVRSLTEPTQVALAMERYVFEKVQKKDFSTALGSAAEVAKTLQGDCTEHAVLLAAMLRARNIPSRIVVGFVYIEPLAAFGGHMWTEALLGDRWVPLDATLGQGGIGAAHIKLIESSFADDGPAPFALFLPLIRLLGRVELTVVETIGPTESVIPKPR